MKFRKKPVVIEAYQWDGTFAGSLEIDRKFEGKLRTVLRDSRKWVIGTLEGQHEVSPGDWVIKGIANEFYPCKPHIFEITYERVEEQ